MTQDFTVFLKNLFQVQEAQCPHWEDLQQNSTRQVPLGHWYGWSWLCVLTTVLLVARVISWKDCVQWHCTRYVEGCQIYLRRMVLQTPPDLNLWKKGHDLVMWMVALYGSVKFCKLPVHENTLQNSIPFFMVGSIIIFWGSFLLALFWCEV
jgi:hypothetical protein